MTIQLEPWQFWLLTIFAAWCAIMTERSFREIRKVRKHIEHVAPKKD